MIALYFFFLMADGRKLEERLCRTRVASGAKTRPSGNPRITANHALWTSHPFEPADAPRELADSPRAGKEEFYS